MAEQLLEPIGHLADVVGVLFVLLILAVVFYTVVIEGFGRYDLR